jgi:hypothetical protein
MIRWREVAESYPCEVCGSPPGVRCITISGRDSNTPHCVRSALASANGWLSPDETFVGHSAVAVRTEDTHASSPE